MKHLGTKELETQRLILRRFNVHDAEKMFANWASDDDVTKYLTWKSHNNVSVTKNILEDWVKNYDDNGFYQWAITLKENTEPIGSISVVRKDDDIRMIHVGYCIGKKWWNKGLTSEALFRLIRFFYEESDVNRIESTHDPKNPNSGKVMVKCGLKYEGLMRQAGKKNQGELCDLAMYAMLREDYCFKV